MECRFLKCFGCDQVYVQKRNEIVLEDTAQGFLDGRWKWNVPVEGFDDDEEEEETYIEEDD